MSRVIWVHEDALSHAHNIFDKPHDAAIFIWDAAYFEEQKYSLKRLVFIYESLCEMDVDIVKGAHAEVLSTFKNHDIFSASTLNPALQKLGNACGVEWVDAEEFVTLKNPPTLKRFFNYWNKAKKSALKPDGGSSKST